MPRRLLDEMSPMPQRALEAVSPTSRLSAVRIYPRIRRTDARGWLVKLMTGQEEALEPGIGEVYATLSWPGEERGHHYHPRTCEWFTVLEGLARIDLEDPDTGEQLSLELCADEPLTVSVPSGIAHTLVALGSGPMLLIAAASLPYDPSDVVPHPVIPRGEVVRLHAEASRPAGGDLILPREGHPIDPEALPPPDRAKVAQGGGGE